MMGDTSHNLEEAIQQLSQKRKDVLTEESLQAKRHFDEVKHRLDADPDEPGHIERRIADIEAFNENVKILVSVFYKSGFDEFIYAVANPQRVFTINFFIGIFRGFGFMIGALFLLFLVVYSVKELIPAPLIHAILQALK